MIEIKGTLMPRGLRTSKNSGNRILWKTDDEALLEAAEVIKALMSRDPMLLKAAIDAASSSIQLSRPLRDCIRKPKKTRSLSSENGASWHRNELIRPMQDLDDMTRIIVELKSSMRSGIHGSGTEQPLERIWLDKR
jgi:hypothetical protein